MHDCTIKFKFRTVTLVLNISPTSSFAVIKEQVLDVMRDVSLDQGKTFYGVEIPQGAEEMFLGKAVDLGRGRGYGYKTLDEDDGEAGNHKGGLKDCPQGQGLRNGDVVAVRIGTDGPGSEGSDWGVIMPSLDGLSEVENDELGQPDNVEEEHGTEVLELEGKTDR